MSYVRRTIVSLALFVALPACATVRAPDDASGAAPALFVARDADSTLYLYGAIHLRRQGDPWGGAHVETALEASEEIWTEVSLTPESEAAGQAAAMRLGISPPDRPLPTWLDVEAQGRLRALSERLGIPAGALTPMRPWMAALSLSVVPMVRAGYDPQAGVDRAIAAWGAEHGRTLRAFETSEQQVMLFAGLSGEAQTAMLLDAIDKAEAGPETVNALSTAWDRGDIAAIDELAVGEVRARYPRLYDRIYVQRNNAWVGELMTELRGAGVDFVAVGSGHMYGPDGLIAQLRERGVPVERVR